MNRLESVFNYEKQLGATYQYNGLGHRIGKIEGQSLEPVLPTTNISQLNLDPTKQIEDVTDITRQYHNLLSREENQSTTSFTWDFEVLSANTKDGTLHYLHDDLGSPIRLMNEYGNELEALGYDDFGNDIDYSNSSQQPTKKNQPFGFTGYQYDSIAENHFAQARQYDSRTGRFLSEDLLKGIVEAPFTFNPYVYCWNQPLDFIDLDGLDPVFIGYIYIVEAYNGNVYVGSTAQELKQRLGGSGHRWNNTIRNPQTKISFQRVYAEINVGASGQGTTRSAVIRYKKNGRN